MKCKHRWIELKDGTRDKICIDCGKRAKQAVMYFDNKPREKEGIITINIGSGDINTGDIVKEIANELKRIGSGPLRL